MDKTAKSDTNAGISFEWSRCFGDSERPAAAQVPDDQPGRQRPGHEGAVVAGAAALKIRIAEAARHPGGGNIFGRGFGDYDQDILMRIYLREADR